MKVVVIFLLICLLVHVVSGTLSKTDAKKASKIQEAEVRQKFYIRKHIITKIFWIFHDCLL